MCSEKEQYESIIDLAHAQLPVTQTYSEWLVYIEGVTDTIFALNSTISLSLVEVELLKMWEEK